MSDENSPGATAPPPHRPPMDGTQDETVEGHAEGFGPETPRTPETATLRTLVAHALVISLTPLIPIPFVDDWTRDRLRRWQVEQRLKHHGATLGDDPLGVLALGQKTFQPTGCLKGCALGAMIKTTLYVLKKLSLKIFRKILVFLTIKDCADQFARTLDEGILCEHALATGRLGKTPKVDQVRAVRHALEQAMTSAGRGPIEQVARAVFSGSRGLIRHAGRTIAQNLRKLRRGGSSDSQIPGELERQSEAELGTLIDTLTREVGEEAAYFDRLIKRFEEALAQGASVRIES